MTDNSIRKAIKIGSVKIKMFNGAIRIVGGERHAMGLKKSLLSIGALNSRGCKYFVMGGVLKIIKGNTAVIKD